MRSCRRLVWITLLVVMAACGDDRPESPPPDPSWSHDYDGFVVHFQQLVASGRKEGDGRIPPGYLETRLLGRVVHWTGRLAEVRESGPVFEKQGYLPDGDRRDPFIGFLADSTQPAEWTVIPIGSQVVYDGRVVAVHVDTVTVPTPDPTLDVRVRPSAWIR